MGNKLIQVWGVGFGATPANITVTVDGVESFTGDVPTLDLPPTSNITVDQQQLLFSINYDGDSDLQKTIQVQTNVGAVTLGFEKQNYIGNPNPVFTSEEYQTLTDLSSELTSQRIAIRFAKANPPFSAEEQAVFSDPATDQAVKSQMAIDHNVLTWISTGADNFLTLSFETRTNVTLDGVPQTPSRQPGELGCWTWLIPQGSTLSYLNVIPSFYTIGAN